MAQDVVRQARLWAESDPDPITRAELNELLARGDMLELEERVGRPLHFGTAGLRGIIGAGSNRMNVAVVRQVTWALAEYLRHRVADWRVLPVVVGHDARPDSQRFAADAAAVLLAAGCRVRYFEGPVPTPLVAYAAKQLGAAAAVVVTASHNPREYNGYKVYAGDGSQITPPADAEISAQLAKVGPACEIPILPIAPNGAPEGAEPIPLHLFERYLAELDGLRPRATRAPGPTVVYTPLHGVGWRFMERALRRAGIERVVVVPAQAQPDGGFPTAPFPNPEEPGVLALALAKAAEVRADVVIANDPDADRLSVCIPTPAGRWIQLGGNQVGLLLADFILEHAASRPTPLVVSSIVSSPMLERIALARGARCERTLTGFKWIFAAALELERRGGFRFVFGYEEALGYALPMVRDKDGMSAALLFCDLMAACQREGRSVWERLDELYRRHGVWVSRPRTFVRTGRAGLAQIETALRRLRTNPPSRLGGIPIARIVDFKLDAGSRPRWRAASDLLDFELVNGSHVTVRPSGTEPKLKIYTEIHVPFPANEHPRQAQARGEDLGDRIAEEVAVYAGLVDALGHEERE